MQPSKRGKIEKQQNRQQSAKETKDHSKWQRDMPNSILAHIFSFLPTRESIWMPSVCCRTWSVAGDYHQKQLLNRYDATFWPAIFDYLRNKRKLQEELLLRNEKKEEKKKETKEQLEQRLEEMWTERHTRAGALL